MFEASYHQLSILVLFFLVAVTEAHATIQAPDKVILDGYEYAVSNSPMYDYFKKYPNKRPKLRGHTGLYRGYIATFGVDDNFLILKDIRLYRPDRYTNGFRKMVSAIPWSSQNNKNLRVDWFTGILILPYGEVVQQVGFLRTYSHYVLLEIKDGKLTDRRNFDVIDYELFKERSYKVFKKSGGYRKIFMRLKSQGWSDIDSMIRRNIVMYSPSFLVK